MKRGPLGPGSRGRDERKRGRKVDDRGSSGAGGQGSSRKDGDKGDATSGSADKNTDRGTLAHAGRPLVIASIHRDTAEVQELARTLGLRPVLEVWQNRNRPHPGTFLGRGKLDQLKGWLDEWKAGIVPGDWHWGGDHWVPDGDARREESLETDPLSAGTTSWGGWGNRRSSRGAGGASGTRSSIRPNLPNGPPEIGEFQGKDLLLILDDDVRPAILFNLEERLGVEVWGRSRLILEIFSQHAHLKEARLQVELAQLRYDVPMVHEAIHRKRTGERPGFMGGGEYAVADYEDFIKRRMRTIRDELERVRHDRAVRRKVRRDRFYLVSLAGYTNAGKSSLLSALTGADALQEQALFSTLSTMTRRLDVAPAPRTKQDNTRNTEDDPRPLEGSDPPASFADGSQVHPGVSGSAWEPVSGGDPLASYRRPVLVTDTVGFIRALPSWLVQAFHATLEEIALADVVLLTVDVADPVEILVDKVQVGMTELAHLDVTCPVLIVLNKWDLVSDREFEFKKEAIVKETAVRPDWILGVSARERRGLHRLVATIQDNLPAMIEYRAHVAGAGESQRLLGRLQGWGEIHRIDYGKTMRVEGNCDPIQWKNLQREIQTLQAKVERVG